jgi:hypothetical protein
MQFSFSEFIPTIPLEPSVESGTCRVSTNVTTLGEYIFLEKLISVEEQVEDLSNDDRSSSSEEVCGGRGVSILLELLTAIGGNVQIFLFDFNIFFSTFVRTT